MNPRPLFLLAALQFASCLHAAAAPAPELGLSLHGVPGRTIEQGEPLRISVRLSLDRNDSGALLLAPADGTWVDAIEVQLHDAQGQPAGARAQVVGRPESPVATLDARRIAGGLWRLPAAATRSLAPGDYTLRARLVIAAAVPNSNGWTGEARAEDMPLRIVASAGTRSANRSIALAHDALLDDRLEEAATVLDALLVAEPDNLRAWIVRAAVCERAGNLGGARQCLNRAHALYEALQLREPHPDIHSIQSRVMAALLAPGPAEGAVPRPAPPAWSWPPFELVRGPSALAVALDNAQPIATPVTPPAAPAATVTPPATPPPSRPAAPAAPASSIPSPASVAAKKAPASTPPPAATAPTSPATTVASGVVPLASLHEPSIVADPRGQWAASATASSAYGTTRYDAAKAAGAPDVPAYGDHPNAWCPKSSDGTTEWLELAFVKPVRATEVRVRQSFNPGTLVKIEGFAADGSAFVLWEGRDPAAYPDQAIGWFAVRFEPTKSAINRLKLTLNTAHARGWNQIDAVQLVGN